MAIKGYDNDWGDINNEEYQNFNFYFGQVITDPLKDPSGAGRCKVFIRTLDRDLRNKGIKTKDLEENPENYSNLIDRLPDSYAIETKFFFSLPKLGETVIVFLNEKQNKRFNRYYIGPIVSQPQKLSGVSKILGILDGMFGTSSGLFDYETAWFDNEGSRLNGKSSDSNWSIYPSHPKDPTDVAINGRGNEDIILRSGDFYDEILLRTAKYKKDNNLELNLKNPGYISIVSYDSSKIPELNEDKSSVNIVADQINLISYKGSPLNPINSLGGLPAKSDGLILNSSEPNKQIDLENLQLRPTVYGDVLWEVLKKLRTWVSEHKHSGGGVAYTTPSRDIETTELLSMIDKALGGNPKEKISPNGKTYYEYQGDLISNNIKIN
jgi:hypothetical protein